MTTPDSFAKPGIITTQDELPPHNRTRTSPNNPKITPPFAEDKPIQEETFPPSLLPLQVPWNSETQERSAPVFVREFEISNTLLDDLYNATSHLSLLARIDPNKLPYARSNPRLAQYVANNSVAVYDSFSLSPIGILSAQAETGYLLFQLLSTGSGLSPTMYLKSPLEPTDSGPTVLMGESPYCNPFDINHTLMYPPPQQMQHVNHIALELLERVLADEGIQLSSLPLQRISRIQDMSTLLDNSSFASFAEKVLRNVLSENAENSIQAACYSLPQNPFQVGVVLHRQDVDTEAIITFDAKSKTTSFEIEETAKSPESEQDVWTNAISLDSDGLRLNGQLLTPAVLANDSTLGESLSHARKAVLRLRDAWKITQRQANIGTDIAREELPGAIDYLLRLILPDGTLNSLLPYQAPYLMEGTIGTIVQALTVSPDTTESLFSLLPTEEEFERFPNNTFFGQVAEDERKTLSEDAPTMPLPTPPITKFNAHDLIDETAFADSPFLRSLQELDTQENSQPLPSFDPLTQSAADESDARYKTNPHITQLLPLVDNTEASEDTHEEAPSPYAKRKRARNMGRQRVKQRGNTRHNNRNR